MSDVTESIPNPGVRFPPPLLFVVGFLIGWAVSRRYPLPLFRGAAERIGEMAGLVLGAVGLALIVWGLATFWSRHTDLPQSARIADRSLGPVSLHAKSHVHGNDGRLHRPRARRG